MNARAQANLLGLALAGLSLGTLVYFTRAAGALFLAPDLRHSLPPLFGPPSSLLGSSLPSLTHAFSFTLLSTLALGVTRRAAWVSAALWLAVETLFEVGQHPAVTALLEPLAGLGLGLGYFRSGTFDPRDLAACLVGVGLALFTLEFVRKARNV